MYFTVRSGFFQVRGIRTWWQKTAGAWWKQGRSGNEEQSKITQFQSACTALAATIGTGNIAGVATALTSGGPGAIFWMWISAGIGMMTAYAETWLGIHYRSRQKDGSFLCGPMVYMERGLACPQLGKLYAALLLLVSLGMGSMVQANSLSEAVWSCCPFSGVRIFVVVVLVLLIGGILRGGIQRITRVTEWLVPISAGSYLLFSLAVLLSCWRLLPAIFCRIVREAFCVEAVGGGLAGFLMNKSVRFGLSRGVFSNEAGLGSLAVLHGSAEDTTPEEQGMWAMFEVFFDTVVICTLTALVILCVAAQGKLPEGYDGAALTAWCFAKIFGRFGEWFVAASMVVFAFATMIAWYYLGEQAVRYLTGVHCRWGISVYLLVYLAAVFCGCAGRVDIIWLISDIWNGLLAFPNLLALWLLSGKVKLKKTTRNA